MLIENNEFFEFWPETNYIFLWFWKIFTKFENCFSYSGEKSHLVAINWFWKNNEKAAEDSHGNLTLILPGGLRENAKKRVVLSKNWMNTVNQF